MATRCWTASHLLQRHRTKSAWKSATCHMIQRPSRRALLFFLLSGFTLTLISPGIHWRGNPLLKYWKPVKLKPADQNSYATLSLSEENSSCWNIISGDPESIEKALLKSIAVADKHRVLTDIDYLAMTRDCASFVKSRKYITFPLSAEERNFPLAYSIVINENIEMFERLLRTIYAPHNLYCVHVDRKSPETFHSAVRGVASCFQNVFVVGRLETVIYASWSRVQADLNCMEELLTSPVPWKYLINLCGTDFPIKTNREIVQKLKAMNGSNFIESHAAPEFKKNRWRYHYDVGQTVVRTDEQKTPPPVRGSMFVGSAYILVTREFVRNLFVQQEIQTFFNWSVDTYSPDEHIWATLQRMPEVPGSIPYTPRDQERNSIALTRAVKWSLEAGDLSRGALYPPCAGRYRHLVCVFGSGDLQWIVQQQPLFANKFDPGVDNTAVQCMEQYIRHRSLHGAESLF